MMCEEAPVPLDRVPIGAESEARFGGKSTRLARTRQAGLPVPAGHALSVDLTRAVAAGDPHAIARILTLFTGRPLAVRSSAVGEDSAEASFAGQHLSCLNVTSERALIEAVRRVFLSGASEGSMAYRTGLGMRAVSETAVLVQEMLFPDVAGVLFTADPLSGADERVIEAAWGLGESVVQGLVTPDRYRMSSSGAVLERTMGEKDLLVAPAAGGGTQETPVAAVRAHALCLDDEKLSALHRLAEKCEAGAAGPLDLEWAFADGGLFLLQERPMTARRR